MPKLKIHEPGKKSKSYSIKITRPKITIGRKDSNDIVIGDVSVSSRHCEIRRVEGGYILDDLSSTNGSKIDSQRFIKIDLDTDTSLKLGDVPVDFLLSDEECDILDEEDEFVSEEEKKPTPKEQEKEKAKAKKAKSKKELSDGEIGEDKEIEEDEEYDEEDERGEGTFMVTVIAFVVTIIIAVIILYLTGNLI